MSSSSTLPSSIFDRYLWIAGGIFAVYAAYTTHTQLSTFKARCVSKPPPSSSNNAAVDRATEDGSSSGLSKQDMRMTEQILTMPSTAIKLESLGVLATGANFDLRNAALKIISDRATTDENIDFLVKQIESRNPQARLRALKAVRFLSMTNSQSILSRSITNLTEGRGLGSFSNLCTLEVFRALVTCLKNTLPPTPDTATEKEALYILARLMSFFGGRDMAVQAGIVDWLKLLKIPGYPSVVNAVFDLARFDANDTSLWEIVGSVMDETVDGRRLMIEAGLIPPSDDEEGRGVEVEVEIEVMDLASVQRAQRILDGMRAGRHGGV